MPSLTTLLRVLGAVAGVAGADAVLRGASGVPGAAAVPANVDSEFRYYGAWYVAAGTLLWRAAAAPEQSTATIRATSGALLLGATGRLLSWRSVGRPSAFHRALLVAEVGLGVALPAMLRQQTQRGGSSPRSTVLDR